MIYVEIRAIKSEGRGETRGNAWHDTDDPSVAVALGFASLGRIWGDLGHGSAVTYVITVAPEASPRRTTGGRAGLPLPVEAA